MEIKLTKKPKSPIIIEGFPGLGLIGTISTEFLIKHLKAKSIGSIWSEKLLPIAAVHDSKVIQPLELFYVEKHNLIIIHALSDVRGMEWEISKSIRQLCKILKAKELITIEGIMSDSEKAKAYFLTNSPKNKKKLEGAKMLLLKEGILMGVTAALLLKDKTVNTTGIFVETHSKLPDSKAAAKIIEVLNEYMGLGVDYKPLLKAAEEFEKKLKSLIDQSKAALGHQKSKSVDYMG
jgi:uncharacterized protein